MGRYRIALANYFMRGRGRQSMHFLPNSTVGYRKIEKIPRKARDIISVWVFFSLKRIVEIARFCSVEDASQKNAVSDRKDQSLFKATGFWFG